MKCFPLIIMVSFIVFGCGSSASKKETVAQKKEQEVLVQEVAVDDLALLQHQTLKEQLFFYLRHQVGDVDQYTFVKYEHLTIQGSRFKYVCVMADEDLLRYEAGTHSKGVVHLTSYVVNQGQANSEVGDTLTISGKLEMLAVSSGNVEGRPTTITLGVSGEVVSSYMYSSPYAYGGYDRTEESYDMNEQLVVNLNEPKIYARDELYLKARIHRLTKEELAGFADEQLAYLRNELFARHGHVFKTEKMKTYFEGQSWYKPYFQDATPLLNELEKQNALFIKSLES